MCIYAKVWILCITHDCKNKNELAQKNTFEGDMVSMGGSRGEGDRGSGPPPTPEKSQNIGFICNTGPDPLKITKLPSQRLMLGHHRPASELPFKWRFAGRPMNAHL